MAGNVLRELIARVVLRVDESTVRRLDTQLNLIKSHLAAIQDDGKESIKVNVNATEAERSLVGLRIAIRDLGGDVSPELAANLRQQLDAGRAKAEEVRAAIDKLKFIGGANEEIAKLQTQLSGIESEARETASALKPIEDSFKRAADEAKKLADEGLKRAAAETKRLADEAKKVPSLFNQIKGALGGIGIAIGAVGLIGFVHQTLEAAASVEDLADRLGMGIEEVQVWSALTKQAGADTEALTASTKGLANAMQGAANGGKEQRAAFDALGISTDGWKKQLPNLTETLALVGGRLAELDNEGQRLALTQKLLSEGGLKLAPAFKGGTEAVKEQLEKLKELAVVYSDDFVKSAGAAGDELDLFYGQFRGLGSELILTFLPALRGAVRELTPLIRGFRDGFANSHIFTSGLIVAGATGLASFGGISGALARLAPMLGRLAAVAAPFIAGFLKFVAIALIIDDFFVMLNGGKSVLGELLGKFELGRTIIETFQMGFKLLKGTVLSVWGALSGDQDAINKGASLLDQYANWISGIGDNIKFAWTQLWTVDMPAALTSGLTSLDTFLRETFGGIYTFLVQWGGEIAGVIGAVWDGMIGGLKSALEFAGKLLSNVPGLEGLAPGDAPTAPANALAAGNPYAPTLPASSSNSNVTINNKQQITTHIGANNPREVVAAVDRVGNNATTAIQKDNRQAKRFVTGASR